MLVKIRLREKLQAALPDAEIELSRSGNQIRFGREEIDLTVKSGAQSVAVEVKVKLRSDAAFPDNRTAAFDDLAKLRRYVESEEYTRGLFLWLTNCPEYYQRGISEARDNSTYNGRVVQPNASLKVGRARDGRSREWSFPWTIHFNWNACAADPEWRWLAILIPPDS